MGLGGTVERNAGAWQASAGRSENNRRGQNSEVSS